MTPDYQLWNGGDNHWLLVAVFACAALTAFILVATNNVRLRLKLKDAETDIEDRDNTIAELWAALQHQRFDPAARRAHNLNDWAAPTQPRRMRKRSGLVWPGDNVRRLPVAYGPEKLAKLDPEPDAFPVARGDIGPYPAWLTTPEALSWPPSRTTALTAVFAEALETAPLPVTEWTVPTLRLEAVRG